MAVTNYDRVGKTMQHLNAGLSPFVEREMKVSYDKRWLDELTKILKDYQLPKPAAGGGGEWDQFRWVPAPADGQRGGMLGIGDGRGTHRVYACKPLKTNRFGLPKRSLKCGLVIAGGGTRWPNIFVTFIMLLTMLQRVNVKVDFF